MSLVQSGRGLLKTLWTPFIEQLRFKNRPNLQRPLPPHLRRARMLRLCEPIYPTEVKICDRVLEAEKKKARELEGPASHPYRDFLVAQTRSKFYSHPMIAVFHENSYTMHDFLKMRGTVWDAKFPMELRLHQNAGVMRGALEDTKFQPALKILSSNTMLGYCQTTDIKRLLAVAKKLPKIILIGVIVDGRLLHRVDFEKYAEMSLDSVRGELVHTLSLGSRTLSDTLQSSASNLSHSLSRYVRSKEGETS